MGNLFGCGSEKSKDEEQSQQESYKVKIGNKAKAVIDEKLVDVVLEVLNNKQKYLQKTAYTVTSDSGGKAGAISGNENFNNDYNNETDRGLTALFDKGFFGSLGRKIRTNGRY